MAGGPKTQGVFIMQKVIVSIPKPGDTRWKAWRKLLTGVDKEKTNGYAFLGEFLSPGRKAEVPVGSYILIYDEIGSARHHRPEVSVQHVEADGTMTEVLSTIGKSWALDIRDEVAALLVSAAMPESRRAELEAEAAQLRARLAKIEAELANLA